MKRTLLYWIIAFIATIAIAYYQRLTGPTHPLTGTTTFEGTDIRYRLDRSHGGPTDARIQIPVADPSVEAILTWKRFRTEDAWSEVPMRREEGMLVAELPNQPPAGKLQYRVTLRRGDRHVVVPPEEPVVIRFRGDVPPSLLIPHVLAMFGAMLLSTRTGLEFFSKEPQLRKLTYWTIGFLVAGGFVLGPLVQYYAFNALWTGWPFGTDLTDNKTAVALLAWVAAAAALSRSKKPHRWTLAAAVLLIVIYLIPHSLLGSELDYSALGEEASIPANIEAR